MGDVITFPSSQFTLPERGEVHRWHAAASSVGAWSVWVDPCDGSMVTTDNGGREFIRLVAGGDCLYLVEKRRGRWLLSNHGGPLVGLYPTLRDVLEAVCRTLPTDAA
jgi:hypothetical protein